MNKRLYLGIYAGSFALAVLGILVITVLGVLDTRSTPAQVASSVAAMAVIQFLFTLTIYPLVLLAKMWGSIQDGVTPVTPGKAIGFLFIPFFNLYWIFRVWAGFAADYDNYVLRHNLNIAPLVSGSFICYPIFALLGGLLYLPMVALPFVLLPVITKACDAVNELSTARITVWVR